MIRFFCLGWLKPVLFAMFLYTHVQVEVGSGECWGNLKETAGIPYRGARGLSYSLYAMETFDKDHSDIPSSL